VLKDLAIFATVFFAILAYPSDALTHKSRPLVVAIIDTGISSDANPVLCKFGHKDFTGTGIYDTNGHGTNISGIIDNLSEGSYYCQVILKYYNPKDPVGNARRTIQAFRHAIALGVDMINYSSYGEGFNIAEKKVVTEALNKGIVIMVPSGNKLRDLDVDCKVYPSCYDSRMVVVGNSTNRLGCGFGSVVDIWEDGTGVTGFGITLSGTSQSTAIATGKTVRRKAEKGRYEKNRSINSVIVR